MNRPEIPDDITPEKFFMQFVPSQFEKNKSSLPKEAFELKAAITFELTGPEGGIWTLMMDEGELVGVSGDSPHKIVKIVQTIDDWRSAIRGEKGFRFNMPAKGSSGGPTGSRSAILNQQKIDRLKDIEGSIKFRLIDPEKGDWEIAAVFESGDPAESETGKEPNCTITLSAADAAAMRKGELNPQTAFMSGKIHIKGDIGFAMQIGTALML